MPSAQTANASRGARPGKRVPLRSHWPIFATFSCVVWPTMTVLCFLVHTTLQPAGGEYQTLAQQRQDAPPAQLPFAVPFGAPPQGSSAAMEAIVPPEPVGRLPAPGGGGPFLTNASSEASNGYQYAGQ